MGVFCACGKTTNGNTGTSNAALQLKRPDCYYFVPQVADDGTKNTILAADFVAGVLSAAFITEKLNHIDPSKRWYPVPNIVVNTNERASPETTTFDGGRNSQITAEGLRPVSIEVTDLNAKYKRNLDRLYCNYPKLAFFEIDECGSVGGEENATDKKIFEPHPIAAKTFYTMLKKAQGTAPQTLMISFEYSTRSIDANECIIPSGALGLNLCDQDGLLNLLATISAESTTGFTAALALEYGGFYGGSTPQTGLLPADFTLFNETTQLAVTIITAPETPAGSGSYDFTFAAQTTADVLTLQQAFTGDKYDKEGFELVEPTITIP